MIFLFSIINKDLNLKVYIRGNQFRPAMRIFFWFFVINFIILAWIGSEHPESPYIEVGQISTAFYFAWFIIIVPTIGLIENTLFDISTKYKIK